MYYIVIPRINSRLAFFELVKKLEERGYDDRVEYCDGGWADNEIQSVLSHLKFSNKEDALAYVLTYGGSVLTEIPLRKIKVHNDLS